jgi:hypothetical protein
MAGYSGTPLAKKLGIKQATTLAVLDAPNGFVRSLGGLPEGVVLRTQLRGRFDTVLAFVTARARLETRLPAILRSMGRDGALWVCWPKKASKQPTDMTEDVVREIVLPLGLVDIKVAAIDETWSGLKVVWRKERR